MEKAHFKSSSFASVHLPVSLKGGFVEMFYIYFNTGKLKKPPIRDLLATIVGEGRGDAEQEGDLEGGVGAKDDASRLGSMSSVAASSIASSWDEKTDGAAIEVVVENVFLVVGFDGVRTSPDEWLLDDLAFEKDRLVGLLMKRCETVLRKKGVRQRRRNDATAVEAEADAASNASKQRIRRSLQGTFWQQFHAGILKTLGVNRIAVDFRNIEIRFEDCDLLPRPISAGFKLGSMSLRSLRGWPAPPSLSVAQDTLGADFRARPKWMEAPGTRELDVKRGSANDKESGQATDALADRGVKALNQLSKRIRSTVVKGSGRPQGKAVRLALQCREVASWCDVFGPSAHGVDWCPSTREEPPSPRLPYIWKHRSLQTSTDSRASRGSTTSGRKMPRQFFSPYLIADSPKVGLAADELRKERCRERFRLATFAIIQEKAEKRRRQVRQKVREMLLPHNYLLTPLNFSLHALSAIQKKQAKAGLVARFAMQKGAVVQEPQQDREMVVDLDIPRISLQIDCEQIRSMRFVERYLQDWTFMDKKVARRPIKRPGERDIHRDRVHRYSREWWRWAACEVSHMTAPEGHLAYMLDLQRFSAHRAQYVDMICEGYYQNISKAPRAIARRVYRRVRGMEDLRMQDQRRLQMTLPLGTLLGAHVAAWKQMQAARLGVRRASQRVQTRQAFEPSNSCVRVGRFDASLLEGTFVENKHRRPLVQLQASDIVLDHCRDAPRAVWLALPAVLRSSSPETAAQHTTSWKGTEEAGGGGEGHSQQQQQQQQRQDRSTSGCADAEAEVSDVSVNVDSCDSSSSFAGVNEGSEFFWQGLRVCVQNFNVVYMQAPSDLPRLRTIVARARSVPPSEAMLLLQGVSWPDEPSSSVGSQVQRKRVVRTGAVAVCGLRLVAHKPLLDMVKHTLRKVPPEPQEDPLQLLDVRRRLSLHAAGRGTSANLRLVRHFEKGARLRAASTKDRHELNSLVVSSGSLEVAAVVPYAERVCLVNFARYPPVRQLFTSSSELRSFGASVLGFQPSVVRRDGGDDCGGVDEGVGGGQCEAPAAVNVAAEAPERPSAVCDEFGIGKPFDELTEGGQLLPAATVDSALVEDLSVADEPPQPRSLSRNWKSSFTSCCTSVPKVDEAYPSLVGARVNRSASSTQPSRLTVVNDDGDIGEFGGTVLGGGESAESEELIGEAPRTGQNEGNAVGTALAWIKAVPWSDVDALLSSAWV
eukprot:TRINITY_DN8038_c0_g1_i2.p1 TRINITY_DN8038_c0_g1~~TRINITY_DN8038_c0_g1_i2.p1  ORF type:complete len:1215 (-),score=254.10 TRINITY_DN8038_c0_g1_i2:67-3711(-)